VLAVHERLIDLLKTKKHEEAGRLLESHIRDSFSLFQKPLQSR
jgi:hypothetical protein